MYVYGSNVTGRRKKEEFLEWLSAVAGQKTPVRPLVLVSVGLSNLFKEGAIVCFLD